MQVDPPLTTSTDAIVSAARCLSQAELRQLGLSLVAYVTGTRTSKGDVDYIIRGADGIAVAVVDTQPAVEELAEQLGLVLVTVH